MNNFATPNSDSSRQGRPFDEASSQESSKADSAVSSPTPPALPWMEWEVGQRVVVRYRKPDGLYDALGHLTEVEPTHVTVNTRKGLVTVPAEVMVTGKRVPESPFG